MENKAIFSIAAGGIDVTAGNPALVHSIIVTDRAGSTSDSANIVLDDTDGVAAVPTPGSVLIVRLGFKGRGWCIAFMGTVDEVRSAGSRSGRKLTITGKGFDTTGKVKEPQQRHFDEMTIEDMLAQAGQSAGVGRVLVDPDLASIMRTYEHMDDESFAAFGQRIAEEVGGTFKLRNGSAVLAKRNSQRNPGGLPLPSVIARWGDNLHSWDVVPFVGRHRFQQVRVRYYERDQAKHDEVVVSTNLFGTEATAVGRYEAPDRETAQQKADSLAAESERQSGVGSLTIEGNVGAQPEATCVIAGTRPGVDGAYLIDGVDHTYTRGAGFTTKLTLANRI